MVLGVKQGDRFERLTVVEVGHARDKRGGLKHLCRCDCGNTVLTVTGNLKSGNTRSCGCLRRELAVEQNTIHGHSAGGKETPTFKSWMSMRARCNDPNHNRWRIYGGRGIKICARWRDDFGAFLEDMGERPPGTSLDRIDGNGDYEPSNCRWADVHTQTANRRTVKLSMEKAEAIRAAARGGAKGRALAAEYGVRESTVSAVLNNHIWKPR